MARVGGARTGADGSYRAVIAGPPVNRTGDCLRAHAVPDAAATRTVSDTVPFAVRFSTAAVRDSVQVNLVLRSS